jgi:hypothetical protein
MVDRVVQDEQDVDSAVAAVSVCGPRRRIHDDELKYRVMWTAPEISRRRPVPSRPRSQRCPAERTHRDHHLIRTETTRT